MIICFIEKSKSNLHFTKATMSVCVPLDGKTFRSFGDFFKGEAIHDDALLGLFKQEITGNTWIIYGFLVLNFVI